MKIGRHAGAARRALLGDKLANWLTDDRVQEAVSIAADAVATVRPKVGVQRLAEVDPIGVYTVWRDRGAGAQPEGDLSGAGLRQRWADILGAVVRDQTIIVLPKGIRPEGVEAEPDVVGAERLGAHLAGWRLPTLDYWWPSVAAARHDIETLSREEAKQTKDIDNMSRGLGFEREYVKARKVTRRLIQEAKAWIKAQGEVKTNPASRWVARPRDPRWAEVHRLAATIEPPSSLRTYQTWMMPSVRAAAEETVRASGAELRRVYAPVLDALRSMGSTVRLYRGEGPGVVRDEGRAFLAFTDYRPEAEEFGSAGVVRIADVPVDSIVAVMPHGKGLEFLVESTPRRERQGRTPVEGSVEVGTVPEAGTEERHAAEAALRAVHATHVTWKPRRDSDADYWSGYPPAPDHGVYRFRVSLDGLRELHRRLPGVLPEIRE